MPNTDQVNNRLNQEQINNLDVLVESIHANNCILLLGPDASVSENDEKPLSEILSNQLADEISVNFYSRHRFEDFNQTATVRRIK